MTDKQIIIDDQKETIHRLQQECTEKTNAIIALGERLKAKEQECEGLKETIKLQNKMQMEVCEEKNEEIEKLKTKNEELKRQHNSDKGLITTTGKHNCQLIQEYDKLKQTLTEIKEITEVLAPMTDEYENCYDRDRCFECDFTEDCQYFNIINIKRILQKISECEVENERN